MVESDYHRGSANGMVVFLVTLAVLGLLSCIIMKFLRRYAACTAGVSGRRGVAASGGLHEARSQQDMEDVVSGSDVCVVMFMAPWCGHCQQTKPAFSEAATKSEATFVIIDADSNMSDEGRRKYEIAGYPTIKKYKNGRYRETYAGDRSAQDIVEFATR